MSDAPAISDPTRRFSSRAENYARFRPGYPAAVADFLAEECGLTAGSVIADLGSGTGLLAELFLKRGNLVYGVEPNGEMRAAGERLLKAYPRFVSIAATAESTTLGEGSVDLVTAGRAFHWFDGERALAEFARILKPEGCVAVVRDKRRSASTAFLAAYERLLLTYAADYEAMSEHRAAGERLLSARGFRLRTFHHRRWFDLKGLEGLLLSLSISPEAGQTRHALMMEELRAIFQKYQERGQVPFEYETTVYYGWPAATSAGRIAGGG